ncbi:hypothetical protein [Aquitalea sp. ASV11]|uniref:hypothetical protein n=1 Tax=Aquitalea sp. ASV11 TaxID=2795103 RepID=UPI0018EDCD5A|nr:hypothetical protein [Aquitalea sp. ASV11]
MTHSIKVIAVFFALLSNPDHAATIKVTSKPIKEPYKSFEEKLPTGWSSDFLIRTIAPQKDKSAFVGAIIKPWPGENGKFIVALCTTKDGISRRLLDLRTDGCSNESSELYVGVFGLEITKKQSAYMLLAKTEMPVTDKVDWTASNIDGNDADCLSNFKACNKGSSFPDVWTYIDNTPYRINKENPTFGINAEWRNNFAGSGSSTSSGLYLISQFNDKLKVVFSAPMSYFKSIEGEWNSKHTKQMVEETFAKNYLIISNKETHGYKNILLREKNGTWHRTYQWDKEKKVYIGQ